jgi:hypothetical protein
MPERLSIGDFSTHLHTRFLVANLENYELELVEVTDHSNAKLEQFSVVFIGVLSPWLPQGVYKLIHARIGEHELFLVPLGPDAAGMRYEASFSRLIGLSNATDGSPELP